MHTSADLKGLGGRKEHSLKSSLKTMVQINLREIFEYTYASYDVLKVAFLFSFLKVLPTPILLSASLSVLIDRPLPEFSIGGKKSHLWVKYQILVLVSKS